MNFVRILLVEDEKKLAAYIKKGLEENHFAVDVSYDGEDGLFTLNSSEYDLVILDILLPRKNGLEILKEARKNGMNMPVLLLTAKDAIVIENAPLGILSAKRAGLLCLALQTSLPQRYLNRADMIFLSYKKLIQNINFSRK